MEAKQKKSKVNVVLLIICIVIAVAAIVTVGIVLHWFDFLKGPSKAKLTMEDYSVITVSKDYVTVTDDEVTTQIESYLTDSAQTTTETTGTVADGDTLNISYTGANMLNGEEVDSNENVAVEIGSGTFIPGFEEGLIGQPIGSTVNLPITFPDDYVEESMRGLPVLFTVTINSRYNTVVPELTEEWIDNFSQQYFGKSCTSEEEFRALAVLVDALLDEGPVFGISALENGDEVLAQFLELAPAFPLTDPEEALLLRIRERLKRNGSET